MIDVAGVESDFARQLSCHVGPVKHSGGAGAGMPGRVPWMSCPMCPRLRTAEQAPELVVDVTGSEEVMAAAARTMSLGRQVPQNAIDRRHLNSRQ